MAKRSRTELKNIFRKGKVPEERNFHDMIDSMVNQSDDGISGIVGGGLALFEGPDSSLLEFYESPEAAGPDWYIRRKNPAGVEGFDLGESVEEKSERSLRPQSRLFIRHGEGIGIDNADPAHTLDVAGAVGMENRVGTYAVGTVPADGQWRNIIPANKSSGPKGYFALEVLAHTKAKEGWKLHSITHALCVGAYPKGSRGLKRLFGIHNVRGIQANTFVYSRKRQRIQFRWAGSVVQPRLEIRSRRRIKQTEIAYRITSLFPA